MSTEAIRIQAVHDALLTVMGMPSALVHENDAAVGKDVTPRVEYVIGRAAPFSVSLAGAQQRRQEIRAVIVVGVGEGIATCVQLGAAIAEAFPVASKVADLTVIAAPHEPGGFKDQDEYRWPIIVPLKVHDGG